MAEQFKSLPPTPEQEIEKRLANAMHHLKLEMASQGVDVKNIACAYEVRWADGEVQVKQIEGTAVVTWDGQEISGASADVPTKPKSKPKGSSSAAEN